MRATKVKLNSLLSSMASKCLEKNIHGIYNATKIMASAHSPLFISIVSRGERRNLHGEGNHKELRELLRDCGLSSMNVLGMIFNELIEAYNEGKIASGSSFLLDRMYNQVVEDNSRISKDAILKNIVSPEHPQKRYLPSGVPRLANAEAFLDSGRPGRAMYAIEEAEQYLGGEQALQIWQALAERFYEEGRYKWAGIAYNSAAKNAVGQKAVRLWLYAATSFDKAGKPAEAGFAYERAAQLTSDEKDERNYLLKALNNYRNAKRSKRMGHVYKSLAARSEGRATERYYTLAAEVFGEAGCRREAETCREMARACRVD